MIEGLYQTALELFGDAVISIEPGSGLVTHANQCAIRMTGLRSGQYLSSLNNGLNVSTSLAWLEELVADAVREGTRRSAVIWEPKERRGRQNQAFDAIAAFLEEPAPPQVMIFIRPSNDGREIEKKLWQRNYELQVLCRTSHVSRSLNPVEVARLGLEVSMELLRAKTGNAYLFDEDKNSLTKVAQSSGQEKCVAADEIKFDLDENPMLGQALRTGEPVLATKGLSREEESEADDFYQMNIPIQSTERVLGILELAGGSDLFFGKDPTLLSQLGFQIGVALENALLHQAVRDLAEIDGLTGAYTRQRAEGLLDNKLKAGHRYGNRFAVLMIDIDHFKSFNDVHGHEVGDRVLKHVAGLIMAEVRDVDYVGRWGGEEFLVVLSEAGEDEALYAAERIRMRIASMRFAEDDVDVPVTISIGVSCYPEHASGSERLVGCADDAMRFAKRSGRNRTQLFSAKMIQDSQHPERNRSQIFGGSGLATIRTLAAALDAKDSYTANHSQAVQKISTMIANQMITDAEMIQMLETAALLHDIGKVSVPDSILNKPGPLDANEWAIIREHPRMGVLILKEAPQLSPILPVVLHHHERFDGTGYPDGLSGTAIPLLARILAVADSFMAMTSARPYRKAMEPHVALQEMQRYVGRHYDPRVMDAMTPILEENEPLIAGILQH